jgi:EAL domain-containing protein (putative c-di-GMP-specific phosphodiesterase class I)/GGDEF domain-containing protein/ActR/RegA family two-component response regulator
MNRSSQGDRQALRQLHCLAAVARLHRTLLRVDTPGEVHEAACRCAVDEAGLLFAILLMADADEGRPLVLANAGREPPPEALSAIFAEFGRRGNATTVIDDHNTLVRLTGTSPLAALATFPVAVDGGCTGSLLVGTEDADYFGTFEIELFESAAADIGFAIEALRRNERRLAAEARMHYLAYYDARTGLPGRVLFEERLLDACSRNGTVPLAIMVVHLQRFSGILHALDQDAGVTVARAVSQHIEAVLPTAVVARLAEAEFAAALDASDGLHLIEEAAWRLQRAVAEPIAVGGQEVFVDPFVGIALFPKDGSPTEVLRYAQVAAVRRGNDDSHCCFFVADMDRGSRRRLELDAALRRAVARQEFELHYQPQVDLGSGQVVGAEALLRWRRPEHGLVMPGEFIPILEETGLICAVGEWVLGEACRAASRWQKAGLPPVRVAVNLSGRQFYQADINSQVRRALHNAQLQPRHLELEVTESMILPDADSIIKTLRDLSALDVSLSLDDFGTGYSSLSYLQRLPVKRLKIDRSFVANITSSPSDAAIVRAVIGMAHSLGIGVIAEGVESEGQLGYLRGLCCEQIQGYHFSPPLAEDAFVALLRDGRSIAFQRDENYERVLLLVDDEPHVLSALRRLLHHSGIRVLATPHASEGFDLLAANRVGVVVCDQRMPEIPGTEFLRRVKELYPGTVRIVLSGYTELNSVIDAVNRGAIYKFLTKPWQDAELLENLDDAFRRHEAERPVQVAG